MAKLLKTIHRNPSNSPKILLAMKHLMEVYERDFKHLDIVDLTFQVNYLASIISSNTIIYSIPVENIEKQ